VDRIFLDANVVYAAAYRDASPLRRLWELKDIQLWTSDYAAAEAMGNLTEDRPQRVPELRALLSRLRIEAQTQGETALPEGVRLVAKDRPILLAAIRVGAKYLLTGDKTHFGAYFGQVLGGVIVLPPAEYFRLRAADDEKEAQ
jgi:predicted nucleic acid-binding protein